VEESTTNSMRPSKPDKSLTLAVERDTSSFESCCSLPPASSRYTQGGHGSTCREGPRSTFTSRARDQA
jgi:hypothetical protein